MTRDWSKIPPNLPSGWLFRIPLRLIPKSAILPVLSGLNQGQKWTVGSSIHGCWLGGYELAKQTALKKFVKSGMTALDIGANTGFYTLAFSRLVGKDGQVWAFEPLAENVCHLLQHVKLNRLRNVTVVQAAVGAQSSIVEFHIAQNNSMGSIANGSEQILGGYKVPVVSLDALVQEQKIAVPDLIKMDIEGTESLALEGAKMLLREHKTIWFIALHGEEQKERCLEILRGYNYRIYALDETEFNGAYVENDEIYAIPK